MPPRVALAGRRGARGRCLIAELPRSRAAGRVVQSLYLAYVALALGIGAFGLLIHYRDPHLVGSPHYLSLMEGMGIPLALATTVSFTVPVTAAATLAGAVFLGRRDDAMALLFAAGLLGLYVFYSGSPRAVAVVYPRLAALAVLVEALALACVAVIAHVFPDGRFRPRWTRTATAALVAVLLFVPDLPATARLLIVTPGALDGWKVGLVVVTLAVLSASAASGQAVRYRRYSTPVERQQQRWVLFGLAMMLVPATIVAAAAATGATRWTAWILFAMALFGSALPVASALALFRYRLFDLERVVSRTVSWTALTVLLTGTYGLLIVALQTLLAPLAGGSDLAVAVSTLTVAALFSTVRRRVQALVDRSFYRSRYDAQRVVEEFGRTLRSGVPHDELVDGLVGVVNRTLQPASAGVWLRPPRSS